MKRFRPWQLVAVTIFACCAASGAEPPGPVTAPAADALRVLWQIGKQDGRNAEFALAPGGYTQYQDDAFFVVGQSSPARDWPYVQPGPTDPWAGLRPHTFTVLFGVATAPTAGACRLELDLLDTHSSVPPSLEIRINGTAFSQRMPPGAGDGSVSGSPELGRRHRCVVEFPAARLVQGNNRLDIASTAGSWILYDCVTLSVPPGVTTAPATPLTELRWAAAAPGEVEHQGAKMRRVRASIVRVGPPLRGELTIDSQAPQAIELTGGLCSADLFVPATDRARKAQVSLAVAGQICGRAEVLLAPGVREVVVVFKTHFDIGYTQLAREVVERYRTTMIDKALEVCDAAAALPPEQRFVWTIPGWPMQQMLWSGQTPERRRRIEKAVADGRLVWHALPFTTHTELLETEDLVRGLGAASRLSRAAGVPLPRDAKMTDVTCHAWLLPTLLRHAGVDFLHLGCNEGVAPARVPRLFWWEGPDGSRLLTMYSVGYGTGLKPPADWPHRTWLAVIHTGDNHGPPTPQEVQQLLDEARQQLPGVRVHIGRLSDFADRLLAENPDLPVVRGDMTDSWIHGPLSDPQGARLARTERPQIAATEALATLLGLWGVAVPDTAGKVAAAYEQSLLYGEHTWGGALYWITPYSPQVQFTYGPAWQAERAAGRFRRLEESWDEHSGYIRSAAELIGPAWQGQLQDLANALDASGPRIAVYNPLPWRRDGLVRVAGIDTSVQAVSPLDGQDACAVEHRGREARFLARDVPPLGYRTYVPSAPGPTPGDAALGADPAAGTLESPFFRVSLDRQRGTVRSLIEKRSGRELVGSPSAPASHFGQYLYERFDARNTAGFVDQFVPSRPAWALVELNKPNLPSADKSPYRAASPEPTEMQVERSEVSVAAVFRAPPSADIPHAVTTKFIVYRGLPCLDVEITLHDKPADPWPEAGWLCLPLAIEQPRFRLGRQNSIIDPTRDIVDGANRHLLGITSGLAVLDPRDQGVGVCPLDHPLISLERPGGWQYSLDFVPRQPLIYVHLFNNQFTSNFRLWNAGTIVSRVRIWTIDRYDPEASLVTPSWEARCPLAAASSAAAPGRLPRLQSGLVLDRKGIQVTAFGPNPDGPGLILRLWEQAGRDGRCTVTLPEALRHHRARLCNLRGEPGPGEISVRDGRLDVPLVHNAPTTVLLTP